MFDIKIRLDLKGLEKLSRRYPDISLAVREAKVTEALQLLEREVKIKTPYGAGPIHLRDSIHSKARIEGQKVAGFTGTPLAHGEPVELGTKPHFPPIEPLRYWVERVLRIEDEKRSRSVAFAIARKIARRGTRGQKMFGKAFDENRHRVIAILNEIPGEIARRANAL